MKRILLSLILSSIALSGCNIGKRNDDFALPQGEVPQGELEGKHFNGYTFPTEEELNSMKDEKLNDPTILDSDELLRVGDMGLEKHIQQIQNPPNEFDQKMIQNMSNSNQELKPINVHHNWKYPQIHQVFINPKIKAINGSYVNNVVGKAWDYYGTPYEYGSNRNTDTTFDCSDFVRWTHLWTVGMDLPKNSSSQYEYVKKFSKRQYTDLSQAKRGDVLFFMSYKGWKAEDYKGINVKAQPVAHNGIYVGNGILVHTASQKTGGVRFDTIKGKHLEYRFIGGGQIIQ